MRRRNARATSRLALVLLGFVVLFFVITIVKIGGAADGRCVTL